MQWGTGGRVGIVLRFAQPDTRSFHAFSIFQLGLVWPSWNRMLRAFDDGFTCGPVLSRDTPGLYVVFKKCPPGVGLLVECEGGVRVELELSPGLINELRARRSWVLEQRPPDYGEGEG